MTILLQQGISEIKQQNRGKNVNEKNAPVLIDYISALDLSCPGQH